MQFDIVYRIKDTNTDKYWDGARFGTVGKMYVNLMLATKSIKKRIKFGDALAPQSLVIVESKIQDLAEIIVDGAK